MTGIFSEYLLLLWVLFSVLVIGMALCHRFTRLAGIELIGYGLGVGVFVHGLLGLLIALSWPLRHQLALLAIGSAVLALVYLVRCRVWLVLAKALSRPMRLSLLLWLLFVGLCIAIVHLEVRWPADLPDGRYISKKHSLNVKIQYMTDLPADNYIPYLVTEFFLRRISFQKEHPILPGQEVSNRTILMSLVALPFRTTLAWRQPEKSALGTFDYAGQKWPDVERLNDDNSFSYFVVIGIFLNSLLLIGLLVLFSDFELGAGLPIAALLWVTNLYFITQTIFTWPKAMAGFFVLLGWNSMRRNHDSKVVALLAAAACHCHPASVVVVISLGLWYAIRAWRGKSSYRPLLAYGIVIVIMALPWFIWTRIILQLSADLIAQNFSGPATAEAMASPINFIWVRVYNTLTTFVPLSFSVYPFNLEAVISYVTVCLPTAVGIFLIGPALFECAAFLKTEGMLLWYGMAVPAALLLLVFSYRTTPLLHGWQPIVGALLFFGVRRLRCNFSPLAYGAIVILQLLCNFWIIAMRGLLIGAHVG